MILGFEEKDIFKMDERRLLFYGVPDMTLTTEENKCKSGRNSKERRTVLLAANVTREKLPPCVIGKVNHPRCFKNVSANSLPLTCRTNKVMLITCEMFIGWLNIINRLMKQQSRRY
jgi:hypothetical protein